MSKPFRHGGPRCAHIIGQDEAIASVVAAIRATASAFRVTAPSSFIFVGSTGVGKTELVKQLALQLFDTVDPLIRLDMSGIHGKAQRLEDHRIASWLCRL